MNILDSIYDIFKITDDNTTRESVVNLYWESGAHHFQPCYEILTQRAIVKKRIFELSESELIKDEIVTYGDIEKSKLFCRLINKLQN